MYNCRYGDENNDDDYLSVLNSIWEKYQGEDDPEDLSETDMEEILDYLSGKVGYWHFYPSLPKSILTN